MGTSSKGKFATIVIHTKTKKDKNGKQAERVIHQQIRTTNTAEKVIPRGAGRPLTRKDMYNEKGVCILPKGRLPKRYQPTSRYGN